MEYSIWTILCSLDVSIHSDINMRGHLTFLEWTVILAVGIYLTTEVILWIKYLN